MKESRKNELFDALFEYVVGVAGPDAHDVLEKIGFTANEIEDCVRLEPHTDDDNDDANLVRIKTNTGEFEILINSDTTYPGVDVEFIPHNDKELNNVSRPRILFEQPVGCKPRILIWGNPNSEDYTTQLVFDDDRFYVPQKGESK